MPSRASEHHGESIFTSVEGSNSHALIFEQETIESLRELGDVLHPILNRLIAEEGYIWENGKVIKPEITEA